LIIDAHTHMFHKSYYEQLEKLGSKWAQEKAAEATQLARLKPHLVNREIRLALMDKNSIDMQVITPTPTFYSDHIPGDPEAYLSFIRLINDGMARLMDESQGRFIGVGTVPLTNSENAGRELERAINILGLRAITLPSNFEGKSIISAEYEPVFSQCAQSGIPVYIHPNAAFRHIDRSYEADYDLSHVFGWPFETMLALSRLVFSGIMERHPALKIISHHLGGGIPFFCGRIEETYTPNIQQRLFGRVLPEPLIDYFACFYYDTAIGGSPAATRCALDVFGADKILFATDYYFGEGSGEFRMINYRRLIDKLSITDEEKKKILGGNCLRLFNLG
jgi:predicted TIM-barrel fold metal-dependent hydrolase